jgi:NADH-quinone oxidoreductase subunit J
MPNLQYFFYFFACQILGSALVILFTRNVMYAVTSLLSCLLGVAALFVLAGSDLLGVVQLVIYIGGVLVLTLFGVMYTYRPPASYQEKIKSGKNIAIVTMLSLVLLLLVSGLGTIYIPQDEYHFHSKIEMTGLLWLTEYLPIFEIIGFLLLVILVGAGWIGSVMWQKPTQKGEEV